MYCKEQYCNGFTNCLSITKENFCEYMGWYITNGPASGSTYPNPAAELACTFICTFICLPVKLVILIPVCPITTFWPNFCKCDCCCVNNSNSD